MENLLLSIPLSPFLTLAISTAHIQLFFEDESSALLTSIRSSSFLHSVYPTLLCSFCKEHLTKLIKIFWTLHCLTTGVQSPSQEYGRASELSTQNFCDIQHMPHSGTWHSEICSRRQIQLHYIQLTFWNGSVVIKMQNLVANRVRIIYALSF